MALAMKEGAIVGGVRSIVRVEGLMIFAITVAVYAHAHYSWLLLAMLFLTPDLAFLAFRAGTRAGARVYNSVHSYIGPIVLLAAAYFHPALTPFALIWISHIGFDRMLGYGLKYETAFHHTHLGNIARPKAQERRT